VDAQITRAPKKSWAPGNGSGALTRTSARGDRLKKAPPAECAPHHAEQNYSSHPADDESDLLEPLLPVPKKRGRPQLCGPRETLDIVFYVLKTCCQ
jgi:hypothetical protein